MNSFQKENLKIIKKKSLKENKVRAQSEEQNA